MGLVKCHCNFAVLCLSIMWTRGARSWQCLKLVYWVWGGWESTICLNNKRYFVCMFHTFLSILVCFLSFLPIILVWLCGLVLLNIIIVIIIIIIVLIFINISRWFLFYSSFACHLLSVSYPLLSTIPSSVFLPKTHSFALVLILLYNNTNYDYCF